MPAKIGNVRHSVRMPGIAGDVFPLVGWIGLPVRFFLCFRACGRRFSRICLFAERIRFVSPAPGNEVCAQGFPLQYGQEAKSGMGIASKPFSRRVDAVLKKTAHQDSISFSVIPVHWAIMAVGIPCAFIFRAMATCSPFFPSSMPCWMPC